MCLKNEAASRVLGILPNNDVKEKFYSFSHPRLQKFVLLINWTVLWKQGLTVPIHV